MFGFVCNSAIKSAKIESQKIDDIIQASKGNEYGGCVNVWTLLILEVASIGLDLLL